MPATPADLFALLDKLGIRNETVEHQPLFSVEQSRHLRGEIPGAHTKNLFLIDRKDRLFLVIAAEDAKIDLKSLHVKLGAPGRFSFGKPAVMQEVLGVAPGSVTPFAVMNDIEHRVSVVIDEGLLDETPLNFHPLVNTMSTRIEPGGLLGFLDATGHKPQIVPLSEPAAAEKAP
jgi:Ala-tRNA(Pro) deacylase